jgi:hypothetical protein
MPPRQLQRLLNSSNVKGSLPARLGVFVVCICVAVAAFEAWQDYRAHGRELANVASATANLAQSVLQHAEDTVAMADTVLVGMQDRLQV